MLKQKSGFTLIELLVVVAIIGVLSTVVLALFGGARDRSKWASAKDTMANLKTQAAQYTASHNNNFGLITDNLCRTGMFVDDPTIVNQVNAVRGYLGHPLGSATQDWVECYANVANPVVEDTAWSMSVAFPDGSFWCVDSNSAAVDEYDEDSNGVCGTQS